MGSSSYLVINFAVTCFFFSLEALLHYNIGPCLQ